FELLIYGCCKRAFQVYNKIFDGFDAHRKPQQIGWARRPLTFDASAVLDEALDATKRRRPLPNRNIRRRGDSRCLAAFYTDRKHSAEATTHLTRCHIVSRVRFQAGIKNLLDLRMLCDVPGDRHCGGTLRTHAQVQRAQTTHQKRGFHWPENRAVMAADSCGALIESVFRGES